MEGLTAPEQSDVEERREGVWVETPGGPLHRDAFPGRQGNPAVLTFLRETKVGRMIDLAPAEEDEGEEGRRKERKWAGPALRMYFSFVSPLSCTRGGR